MKYVFKENTNQEVKDQIRAIITQIDIPEDLKRYHTVKQSGANSFSLVYSSGGFLPSNGVFPLHESSFLFVLNRPTTEKYKDCISVYYFTPTQERVDFQNLTNKTEEEVVRAVNNWYRRSEKDLLDKRGPMFKTYTNRGKLMVTSTGQMIFLNGQYHEKVNLCLLLRKVEESDKYKEGYEVSIFDELNGVVIEDTARNFEIEQLEDAKAYHKSFQEHGGFYYTRIELDPNAQSVQGSRES